MRLWPALFGYALTGVVLWLAGWNDRVVDESGTTHKGRLVEVREESATLEAGGKAALYRIRSAKDARHGLRSTFASLLARPGPACVGILLQLGAMVVCILRWNVFLNGADLETSAATALRLGFVGAFFNNVLPAGSVGGDLVKAWYAARAHPERKPMAVVSVLADRGIGLFVIVSVAACAVLFAPEGSKLEGAKALAFLFFGACVAALVLLFRPGVQRALRIRNLAGRLPGSSTLVAVGRAFNVYGARPGVVAKGMLVGLAVHAQALAAFWFYGLSLGVAMAPMAILVALPVAQMAASIPGMPGGWGAGSLAFFVALPAAGVPVGVAVALSVTYNLVQLLLSLPGALFLGRLRPAGRSP